MEGMTNVSGVGTPPTVPLLENEAKHQFDSGGKTRLSLRDVSLSARKARGITTGCFAEVRAVCSDVLEYLESLREVPSKVKSKVNALKSQVSDLLSAVKEKAHNVAKKIGSLIDGIKSFIDAVKSSWEGFKASPFAKYMKHVGKCLGFKLKKLKLILKYQLGQIKAPKGLEGKVASDYVKTLYERDYEGISVEEDSYKESYRHARVEESIGDRERRIEALNLLLEKYRAGLA